MSHFNIGLAFKTDYRSKPALKLNRTSYRIKGNEAAHRYFTRFKSLGEIIADLPLSGGEELDEEAPWAFTQQSDDWILEGMASVSTRAVKVRVLYPEGMSCEGLSVASQWTEIVTVHQRKLIEASGHILLTK